jgi:hypothetical protein
MAGAQDLHQIEYRHHPVRDLSPVASSMSSPDSLRAWDSRIRAWVRHPHADRLAESACYQLLPNGQAALAWRYWDQRAAERADGTRGRPLVSRVLVGPASVLTPDRAVALCQAGLTAELVGPMPGEIADDAELPTVSSDAVHAVTHAMAPVLDQRATQQAGLQAVVAAALALLAIPLAVSVRDNLIQKPLPEGVQCPLLWGLRRITAPLLGSGGRDWSFSTFEPPLGEMDPASLPGIVFRQAQEGAQTPPARWRKELKVRPFASDALDPGSAYGSRVEMAGWLVTEYQERGGAGIAAFIAEHCGSERSVQARLERVYDELRASRNIESPIVISGQPRGFVSVSSSRAPSRAEPQAAGPDREEPRPAEPEPAEPEPAEPEPAAAAGSPSPQATPYGEAATGVTAPGPDQREPAAAPGPVPGPAPEFSETAVSGSGEPVYPDYQRRGQAAAHPARPDERARSLVPPKEGQQAPPLPVADRSGRDAGAPGVAHPPPRHQLSSEIATVSYLLRQLELVSADAAEFDAILRSISRADRREGDPDDRLKSWEVISNNDWFNNISKHREFYVKELAEVFAIVVIPELAVQADPPAAIVRWADEAPSRMIGGLLAAAKQDSPEMWQVVIRLLEPVLASRWTVDNSIQAHWDASRAWWALADLGRSDAKQGIRNRFRRH